MKFGRVPSFRLHHKFSSIFRRGGGGGDGQELSPLTKKERSFLLVDKEVNRAFFFLEKLEGPLCGVAGVEDLPVYQEVERSPLRSRDIGGSFLLVFYGEVENSCVNLKVGAGCSVVSC